MKKDEFQAVIKHLYSKILIPKEIKVELDKVYRSSSPVFATASNWVNEFKRGRTYIRPVEMTAREVFNKICNGISD